MYIHVYIFIFMLYIYIFIYVYIHILFLKVKWALAFSLLLFPPSLCNQYFLIPFYFQENYIFIEDGNNKQVELLLYNSCWNRKVLAFDWRFGIWHKCYVNLVFVEMKNFQMYTLCWSNLFYVTSCSISKLSTTRPFQLPLQTYSFLAIQSFSFGSL